MPLFGKKNSKEAIRRDDPALADLLDRLEQLTQAEGKVVDQAAAASGLGVSGESADTIAILITTAISGRRDSDRSRAQKAGHEATGPSAGGQVHPRVVYAAGVLAETFAVRELIDATTWEYLTRPWRAVLQLPAHGTEGVGTADAQGRRNREIVEANMTEVNRRSGGGGASEMPWLSALRDRDNDPRFLTALMDSGISQPDAEQLLAIIRLEIEKQVRARKVVAEITVRKLTDVADACKAQAKEAWDLVVREILNASDAEGDALDHLTQASYEEARPALWAHLFPTPRVPPPGSDIVIIQEEILPDLHAVLALHSTGARWRHVLPQMLATWGVTADQAWSDAVDNIAATPIASDPWPDPASPLRRLYFADGNIAGEWLGLLVHRRPDACPAGHIVAMPFRGSALVLPVDAAPGMNALQPFAFLAAGAYKEASKFDDQLYHQLLWIQPDGTPMVLFDILEIPESPSALPAAFLTAAAAAHQPEGRA